MTIEQEAIAKRIQELTQERSTFHTRLSQLQKELNETTVHIHQLDGAIAVLEQLVTKNE